MPPALATFLTILWIFLLARRDAQQEAEHSAALWIPVLWLGVTGSRFVSQWMELGKTPEPSALDGSPLDAVYFMALIIIGLWVLARRNLDIGQLIRDNLWLVLFMAYGFVSIVWSDFPFVAFKRWIKTLGHPIVALIILTDPAPMVALRIVLKRCAYFLLTVSVLFIKYLPEYGRGFDEWNGEAVNFGVGITKNDLGYLCMVLGIFFVWNILTVRRGSIAQTPKYEIIVSAIYVWMAFWLLGISNSATSTVTMTLGIVAMLVLGTPLVNKRYVGTYVFVAVVLAAGAEWAFDAYENIVLALGRNPSLTDRTVVWADVLALQDRPVLGFGFESFWLGSRLDVLWEKWWWHPNQAHNGYIETYLNLGGIGVVLLGLLLLSTLRRISAQMTVDFDMARLRFALLFAIIVFNYTEAAFKAVHFVWTIFHIVAINVRSAPADRKAAP